MEDRLNDLGIVDDEMYNDNDLDAELNNIDFSGGKKKNGK